VSRVIVFGASGVFGGQVARELAKRGVSVTAAGRDLANAEAAARSLDGDARAIAVDLTDASSCCAALAGHAVAVNCAGPFNRLGAALLDACLDAGCHYADITDDRGYATLVRGYDAKFRERGLVAAYGCSSLPGISGALAIHLMNGATSSVDRARITLFIGNNNPKGRAAVGSLVAGLGRPIAAPQGTIRGFRDREVVLLPPPFGPRAVFNFAAPEYDLFPKLVGAKAVSVKVGFELRLATYSFALLARLGLPFGSRTTRLLDLPGRLLGGFGCSGGAVLTELFFADGSVRRASLSGATEGQRMAALPCALVAEELARGTTKAGAMTAYEFLGARPLIDGLLAAGYQLHGD